jgi:hypothetical protein
MGSPPFAAGVTDCRERLGFSMRREPPTTVLNFLDDWQPESRGSIIPDS